MEEKVLEPHQQRVVDEASELIDKIEKLNTFTHGEVFKKLTAHEINLLEQQLLLMKQYHWILRQRIRLFYE